METNIQMTSFTELNDIALTLLQVTGLLLPVVFLTANFVKNEGLGQFPDGVQRKMGHILVLMVFTLAITGFFATVGILRSPMKSMVLFISVCLLAIFFILYGLFIYFLTKSE